MCKMEDIFSVRIVSVDSFSSKPVEGLDVGYSSFRKSAIKRVPVIRVFGSTPAGQSVCLYVHGVFPYLLLPYHGPVEDFSNPNVKQYLQQLAVSLDQALNTASGYNKSSQQHVFKILLLRGRPFYGFHENEEIFMKIYFYNQSDVKRSSELLQAGAIMNQSYQPHEAHVPFILQFFLDYNLYGMNLLHTKCCWFRKPLEKPNTVLNLPLQRGLGGQPQAASHDAEKSTDGVCSLSQLNHFNWNKLRTKNLNDSDVLHDQQCGASYNDNETQNSNAECHHVCQTLISHLHISHGKHCPFHTTWSETNIPSDAFLTSKDTDRLSTCDLEVDIIASDIVNRNEILENVGKNPGIESIWADEKARRVNRGESSNIDLLVTQGPRPTNTVWKKEAQYLKEISEAVSIYYARDLSLSAQHSIQHNPSDPSTDVLLSSVCQSFESSVTNHIFDIDGNETEAETKLSLPIVENEVISQVVASQAKSDKSSQDLDCSLVDVLQDMDTVGRPISQDCHVPSESQVILSDDETQFDFNDEEKNLNLKKSLYEHDVNESYIMSQAWECGIENLIEANETNIEDIPQLDGVNDEIFDTLGEARNVDETGLCPTHKNNAKNVSSVHEKSVDEKNSTKTKGSTDVLPNHVKECDTEIIPNMDPILNKDKQSTITRTICRKLRQQNLSSLDAKNPNTTDSMKRDENSNMFSTFQALINDISSSDTTESSGQSGLFDGVVANSNKQNDAKTVVDLSQSNPSEIATRGQDHSTKQDCDNVLVKQAKQISNVVGASVTISSNPGEVITSWDKPAEVEEESKASSISSTLRPRRSRQTSSYVNQSFFETEFEHDWDDFAQFTSQQKSKQKRNVGKNRSNRKTGKRSKRRSRDRVIIKWIITNRFKGVHNMGVKLWKIPLQKQVTLSENLLQLYELYSPRKPSDCNGPIFDKRLNTPCVQPPQFPSPPKTKIPKGKRTKANVVTQFNQKHELLPSLSLPVVSEEKLNVESDPKGLISLESVERIQTKRTSERNLFSDALLMTEETTNEIGNKSVQEKCSEPTENPTDGKIQATETVSQSQSLFQHPSPGNKISKPGVPVAKQTNLSQGKLKKLFAAKKHVPKKYSHLLGRSLSRTKISSEILKRVMKKSNKRKILKLKAKNLKKSRMLPVTSRTVTPVNQSSAAEGETLPNCSNVPSDTSCNSQDTEQKGSCENIFTRISPFIASETAAMLKTIPEISTIVYEDDKNKGKETPHSCSLSEPQEIERKVAAPKISSIADKYLPTRRVTRRSVAARMKSLDTPEWMFDIKSDESCDQELLNVLDMFGRQSPLQKQKPFCISPPRPWSPMLFANTANTQPEENNLGNMQPDTEELGIDAETVLNSIEGMDDIIRNVKLSACQEDDDTNLLSHLDALLNSEDFASECGVETSALDECLQQPVDLKATTKDVVSFMDILIDDQPDESAENNPSYAESTMISNEECKSDNVSSKTLATLSSNIYQTINVHNSPSEDGDASKVKGDYAKCMSLVDANESNEYATIQVSSSTQSSGSSLVSNTRAIPNKQSLQEQLHKQMQAVYLQQQMLDNNNFRTQSLCLKNSAVPIKKLCNNSKEIQQKSLTFTPNCKAPKDVLNEVCQHVFSDTTGESPVSNHYSTFNIINQNEVLENKKGLTPTGKNTFLYPCQGLTPPSSVRGKPLPISEHTTPILHVPVPQANPLQVVHTHVHHHHHIHSIKGAHTSAQEDDTKNISFDQTGTKLPKSEENIESNWPIKMECGQPAPNNTQLTSGEAESMCAINSTIRVKSPSPLVPVNKRPFSILMKPTCQNGDEKYWLQVQMQHGIPWYGKLTTTKMLVGDGGSKAKTPYRAVKFGDSKPSHLSGEDHFKFPASRRLNHLKRKAPMNTPTICLNQSTKKSIGDELETDKFEMSQDICMNEGQVSKSDSGMTQQLETKPDLFKPPQPKKRSLPKKKKPDSKLNKSKINKPNVGKSVDGSRYCSRFTTVPLVASRMHKLSQDQCETKAVPPCVSEKEQLILNHETGQWEIVEKDLLEIGQDIPVLLQPEEQTLGNFVSIAELDTPQQSTEIVCEKSANDQYKTCFAATGVSPTLNIERHKHNSNTHDKQDDELEYIVQNTNVQPNSLKLTLKKKSVGNATWNGNNVNTTHGRGKPSSYETIVKGHCKNMKKSSKKRKLSKMFELDTSVSDTFVETTNLTDSTAMVSTAENCKGHMPFVKSDHLDMVKKFCMTRSAYLSIPGQAIENLISENDAQNALSALNNNAKHEILKEETIDPANDIVFAPVTSDQKVLHNLIQSSRQENTSRSESKEGLQLTQNIPSTIMKFQNDLDEHQRGIGVEKKQDIELVATPAPPTREVVASSSLCHNTEESPDPFYSDANDVQATSTRLFATLPAYVKIPKLKSGVTELQDFSPCCITGLNHWRLVLAGKALSHDQGRFDGLMSSGKKLAQQHLSKDLNFHDTMDVVYNMTKYPFLKQALPTDEEIMVVTPVNQPPSYKDVQNWLNNRHEKKKVEKDYVSDKILQMETTLPGMRAKENQPSQNPSTPNLKTTMLEHNPNSKPRKVSFDTCEKCHDESSLVIEEYKSFEEDSIPQNQLGDQSTLLEEDDDDDSLVLRVSTESDSMLSFSSPQNDKSKSASSSAIATLIGSSNDDKEDIQLTPLLSGKFLSQNQPSETSISSQLQSTPQHFPGYKTRRKNLQYTPISGQAHASVTPGTSVMRKSQLFYDKQLQKVKGEPTQKTPSLQTPNMKTSPYNSEIVGATLNNSYGFRASQLDLGEAKALHERQHLTVVSMEMHIQTRLELKPDPEMDPVMAIFYAVQRDSGVDVHTGAFIVHPNSKTSEKCSPLFRSGVTNLSVSYVCDEMELFTAFVTFIIRLDPDILLGYEVQMLSWGYLLDRAEHLGVDLCRALSRVPGDEAHNRHHADADIFGADNASEIHIVGRICLNLWRLMRTEIALCDYSFESIAFHLLHERYPSYSEKALTTWFSLPSTVCNLQRGITNARHRVIDYYMSRVLGNLKLINQQDMIGRTSELARLFGIQFYEVLTRGSQFRVESMMLRLAHSLNYVAVSPTKTQRAGMKAPECIPLVMEPQSRFYSEPVIVLDFQSLYPSVVIAHNYCFSTCLGRVQHFGKQGNFTFGCSSLNIPPKVLRNLLQNDALTVAPNGVAYVKSSVRRGVLPTMLDEILNTRIMVKNSMKQCDDSATKRLLDHRQLGLKLIANVTYGYTSASFSGRMPCVEIADSIVHKARETLERAIELVHNNYDRWEARVVYGDTDSMFVALKPGTSKKRAFEVGREIVHDVTYDNPAPMKLKLEKVYQPCILQTKKRYVGYAYESEDQTEPIFDAKGIETVRRDGCPAVSKILEKSLRILFESRDVSQVKSFVEKQWSKILEGRSTLQDCTIAKEYRGAKYYRPGAIVPALILARKKLAEDKRSEPRLGERVPYVIVHGVPGTPLFRLVRQPHELLREPTLRLHGTYYVTKMVLPALDRVMSLVGVDVQQWYIDLPRTHRLTVSAKNVDEKTKGPTTANVFASKKNTISQYFQSRHCVSCKGLSLQAICDECVSEDKRQTTTVTLLSEARRLERKHQHICLICQNCSGASSSGDIKCQSMSCPIIYKYFRSMHDLNKSDVLREAVTSRDMF